MISFDLFKGTEYISYYQSAVLKHIEDAHKEYGDLHVKNETINSKKYIILYGKIPCVNEGCDVYLPISIQLPYDYPISQPQISFPKVKRFKPNMEIDGYITPKIEKWSPLGITLKEYIDELVKYYSNDNNYPYKRESHELTRLESKFAIPNIHQNEGRNVPRRSPQKKAQNTPKEQPEAPKEIPHEVPEVPEVPKVIQEDNFEADRSVAEGFIYSHGNEITSSCNNDLTSFKYMMTQSKLTANMINILEQHKKNVSNDLNNLRRQLPSFQLSADSERDIEDRSQTLSIKETIDTINALYADGSITAQERDSFIEMYSQ